MLYRGYRYATYTMELTADKAEAGLGRSRLCLAYIRSLYRALLAPTCVILGYYSRDCIRLAYAMNIRRQVYLLLPLKTAAAARALFIISICPIYAISTTNLVSPNQDLGQGLGLYTSISIYFLQVYIKHILTIIVAKGARINGTGHLWIIKVCNYKVVYSKRRHGIYQSKIQELILPQPYVSICNAYVQVMQYIPGVDAVVLWRSCDATTTIIDTGYATRMHGLCFNDLVRQFNISQ